MAQAWRRHACAVCLFVLSSFNINMPERPIMLENQRLVGAAKDTLLAGPSIMHLDITTACNITCNFCWIHAPLVKDRCRPRHVPFSVITKAIDQAHVWKTNAIIISGDGEPTLHPRFKDIVAYIHNRGIKIFMTSNGTFPEKLLPAIAHIDLLHINLSVADPQAYASVHAPRAPGLFKIVLRNLQVIRALNARGKKPALTIACIVNKSNFRDIPKTLEYMEQLDAQEIRFRIMEAAPETRPLSLSPGDNKELAALIRPLCRKKFKIAHNLRGILAELEHKKTSPYRISRCYTGWYNILVDSNLNVTICCHNEKLVIGSLKKDSLKEIWESPRAQKIRLMCKYSFDMAKAPFKGECGWCHWHTENRLIDRDVQKLNAKQHPRAHI
ncbi:MAG: radical SAM protein [Candidatus Omnitrophica bacterium]|nr:radical SAM protein [Candidatus Omnitrophota bacterium]